MTGEFAETTDGHEPVMVLLVDDQAMVGEAVRRMLVSEKDLDLHYCSDPFAAIRDAGAIRPTVILQDLVMPQADGLDIVRRFRAMPETAAVPIVVLSSKEDAEVKSQAFAAGANDYLVKLPDRLELIARLRYHSNAYLAHRQRDEAMRALRESQQKLLQTNTVLLEVNQKLNAFVGMAAHDLRNPLSVILGFATFLLRDAETPPTARQKRFLTSIRASAEFMLRLVNNLLDVSKIEAGDLHLETRRTDLAALVDENVALNSLLAEGSEVTIELEVEPGLPPLLLDPDRIEQVLNNLLSNAVKFSPSGSAVRVLLRRDGGMVLLSVQDHGPGIPADEVVKLFKPFGRTSVKAVRGEKSTGLGLLIAKQVVDGHGGTIRVESTEGRGSTFLVSLPITPNERDHE